MVADSNIDPWTGEEIKNKSSKEPVQYLGDKAHLLLTEADLDEISYDLGLRGNENAGVKNQHLHEASAQILKHIEKNGGIPENGFTDAQLDKMVADYMKSKPYQSLEKEVTGDTEIKPSKAIKTLAGKGIKTITMATLVATPVAVLTVPFTLIAKAFDGSGSKTESALRDAIATSKGGTDTAGLLKQLKDVEAKRSVFRYASGAFKWTGLGTAAVIATNGAKTFGNGVSEESLQKEYLKSAIKLTAQKVNAGAKAKSGHQILTDEQKVKIEATQEAPQQQPHQETTSQEIAQTSDIISQPVATQSQQEILDKVKGMEAKEIGKNMGSLMADMDNANKAAMQPASNATQTAKSDAETVGEMMIRKLSDYAKESSAKEIDKNSDLAVEAAIKRPDEGKVVLKMDTPPAQEEKIIVALHTPTSGVAINNIQAR